MSPDSAPGRSATASACEPCRDFIDLSLSQGRNAQAIYQDLVDDHGFPGRYSSVKRFVRHCRGTQAPEARSVILTPPGEEARVDYGAGPWCAIRTQAAIAARACSYSRPAADADIYIRKRSLRRADIYTARISYAAAPKPDRHSELLVMVQVVEGQSGIEAIYIPCAAIRDYFFAANRRAPWQSQPSFYYLLHLPTDVPFKELRLGYCVRRMELLKQNASASELVVRVISSTIFRAPSATDTVLDAR